MLINIFILIAYLGLIISNESPLLWNIDKPYKYIGFIYTDSHIVVLNPAIQIKLINEEEICNFYVNSSDSLNGSPQPFRVVVKSAHLGLGELELRPGISLEDWRNTEITLSITAEGCHDPNKWSVPATVIIKVLDPPGPIWTKKSYSATVDSKVPIGTPLLRVTAYLPKLTNEDNAICQYLIKSPERSPFQIDGDGNIRTRVALSDVNAKHWVLVVAAKDCSQPVQRQSIVRVLIAVNSTCKLGWTGFPPVLTYRPGSGVRYLSASPGLELCRRRHASLDTDIENCIGNETLRLTTSVELKYQSRGGTNDGVQIGGHGDCGFDYESLRLQRELCEIPNSKTVELLTGLQRQRTCMLQFPVGGNMFPVTSIIAGSELSLYFWIKRQAIVGSREQYLLCQIDEVGENIFSVSVQSCSLRIKVMSYRTKYDVDVGESIPTRWSFLAPQLCDTMWHHVVISASRVTENSADAELSLYIDGEMIEFKSDNPEVLLSTPLAITSSNMTDVFLGQCPKSGNTEFKGLLAGVVMTPGYALKRANAQCLTKCAERLYFRGMNQMNPGMSVSLNSEMQMVIINGHSISEVVRLVKVIGFVNPSWSPRPGQRELNIETEMSCGLRVFNVPPVRVRVQVEGQHVQNITRVEWSHVLISLVSTVSNIIITDSLQANSDTGTGVAIFANTTIELTGTPPQSTRGDSYEANTWAISRCLVLMHPALKRDEYLDWPRHLLDAVHTDKYSIQVTNTSRRVTLYGWHNQQVYQFVIQHLKYFSSGIKGDRDQVDRTFKLQCFSSADKSVVKSNVAIVKVTIWFNTHHDTEAITTEKSKFDAASPLTSTGYSNVWQEIIDNITLLGNDDPPLHAQSNVARISEMGNAFPRRTNNIMYNVLLGVGLVTLVAVLVMLVGKYTRRRSSEGYMSPYRLVDRVCFPLQMIKEKIRPSPSVRVELSRDFINCISERRRDVSMEMQWDDTEMKSSTGLNIISNPMYETSAGDIDDISLNKDVPPACEDEDSTTDDEIYGDLTDSYFERCSAGDKMKRK